MKREKKQPKVATGFDPFFSSDTKATVFFTQSQMQKKYALSSFFDHGMIFAFLSVFFVAEKFSEPEIFSHFVGIDSFLLLPTFFFVFSAQRNKFLCLWGKVLWKQKQTKKNSQKKKEKRLSRRNSNFVCTTKNENISFFFLLLNLCLSMLWCFGETTWC